MHLKHSELISAENNPEELPESKDEFDLHMEMSYKDTAEVAEEKAINKVFADNRYSDTSKRITYDITTIGVGAAKTRFSKT